MYSHTSWIFVLRFYGSNKNMSCGIWTTTKNNIAQNGHYIWQMKILARDGVRERVCEREKRRKIERSVYLRLEYMCVCVKSHILKCVCLYFCRWDRFCERRNLSSRSRVEPTYTLTSVLFFSSEQIIVVQEWLLESNILYLYPNNRCS